MNFSYFRKSNFDFVSTLENLKKEIKVAELDLLSEVEFESGKGKLIFACNKDWLKSLVSSQKDLFSLLPCTFVVFEKEGEVWVGVGDPQILGKISDNPQIVDVASRAERAVNDIVNRSCGVGPLVVKKVKLYATTTCPYCKMEAAWLDSQKIKYDYVYVDLNPQAAEEMVKKTGQMGVPVTEIVYDNDEKEYIIGFDRPRLTQILGVKN